MAYEHISYKNFLNEITIDRKTKTKVRYKGKEYQFWYEKGKYCFQEYFPESKEIEKFSRYETMLEEIRIEQETIESLWGKEDFEYLRSKPVAVGYTRGYGDHMRSEYRKNSDLYTDVLASQNFKLVQTGEEKIPSNIQHMIYLWSSPIITITTWISVFLAIFSILKNISAIYVPYFLVPVLGFLTLMPLTFFTYLLNRISEKWYYTIIKNWQCTIPILVSNIFINIKLLWLSLIFDILGIVVGYFAYKIYYNRKLKEAEKIREEYRREHPEENVG